MIPLLLTPASLSPQYDLSSSTYSPDGRIYQIEYAAKAVENSGSCVGLRCSDGVVFAAEKLVVSKLLVAGSSQRMHHVGRHHALCVAGLSADCRQLVVRARQEASSWLSLYGTPMPTRVLAERVGSYVHQHTLFAWMRPFGAAVLLSGWDAEDGYRLYALDPAGSALGYSAASLGKAASAARNELEKLSLSAMTVEQALAEAARVIHRVHDDVKDREWELELSYISDAAKHQHVRLDRTRMAELDTAARAAIAEDYDSE